MAEITRLGTERVGVGIPADQRTLGEEAQMNKRLARRTARHAFATATWVSLVSGRHGKKKAWTCTFCGVIGSHRRGCHYVMEAHHRDRKTVRRGILGRRARAGRRNAGGTA